MVFLQLSCDMQYITLLLSKKILYTSLAKGLILSFPPSTLSAMYLLGFTSKFHI